MLTVLFVIALLPLAFMVGIGVVMVFFQALFGGSTD